jgi:hypothetical protein
LSPAVAVPVLAAAPVAVVLPGAAGADALATEGGTRGGAQGGRER